MKNKIQAVLLLSFLFLSGSFCKEEKEKDVFGFGEEDLSLALTGLILNNDFTDLRDGTVLDKSTNLIWQKCTAGQVYKASANDCRGFTSGSLFTPADQVRWGAEPLYFCSNNTWACNRPVFPFDLGPNPKSAVSGISEAFNFCNALNNQAGFPGWRVPAPGELIKLTIGGRNGLLALFPDTQEAPYWSAWAKADDLEGKTAIAVHFDRSRFGEEISRFKTERYYVRCVRSAIPAE
jgi:hypothetical protein